MRLSKVDAAFEKNRKVIFRQLTRHDDNFDKEAGAPAGQTARHLVSFRTSLNGSIRHPFNLRHVVVLNRRVVAVIPVNRNLAPRCSNNRTKIVRRGAPAKAVADFQESGLVAGHRIRPFQRPVT